MKRLFIYLILLPLFGCVSIPIVPLPPVTTPENAAEVTVARRTMGYIGVASAHYFSIDGKAVTRLWCKGGQDQQYSFTFQIDPGKYVFMVSDIGGDQYILPVKLKPRGKYLFHTKYVPLAGIAIQLIEAIEPKK